MEERLKRIRKEKPDTVESFNRHIDGLLFLLEYIWQMPDPLDRVVLTGYYFCRYSEIHLAEMCKVSTKTIQRIKKSAVAKLERMNNGFHNTN